MTVTLSVLASLAGGLGLFIVGMGMMTDGLKIAAGEALRTLLERWTRSALRGLVAGILITAIVQSSTAVTVATVGFVNAGLLTLSQAIWVIFGTNVGTTMTGWLVALVGVKVDVGALALPLVGAGAALRLAARGRGGPAGIGQALTGFGLFFLGINVLQQGFAGLTDLVPTLDAANTGWREILIFLVLGIGLTQITQSSSAAVAITLTASAGGAVPLVLAAAAVIGTNVGTTTTAFVAAIGATAAAKRVASAHILFNLLTGVLALALLVPLTSLASGLVRLAGLFDDMPAKLAVFHTLFNLMGVALMWPLGRPLVAFLETRFVSQTELTARPQHLDDTVLAMPTLALRALVLETERLARLVFGLVRARIDGHAGDRQTADPAGLLRLGQTIRDTIDRLSATPLPAEVAEALPDILRAVQHLDTLSRASDQLGLAPAQAGPAVEAEARALADAVGQLLALPAGRASAAGSAADLAARSEAAYQRMKASLLAAAAAGHLGVHAMERILEQAQLVRRCGDVAFKAHRRLSRWIGGQTEVTPDMIVPTTPPAAGGATTAASPRP
jgi:phosphate:Na+ symporter